MRIILTELSNSIFDIIAKKNLMHLLGWPGTESKNAVGK